MPLIVQKEQVLLENRWAVIPTAELLVPDESGVYILASGFPPPALDPEEQEELKGWIPESNPKDEVTFIELDYSQTGPENVEQILRVRGLDHFGEKVYLSSEGSGALLGSRMQPLKVPQRMEIYGIEPIRQSGEYRRVRHRKKVTRVRQTNRTSLDVTKVDIELTQDGLHLGLEDDAITVGKSVKVQVVNETTIVGWERHADYRVRMKEKYSDYPIRSKEAL